MTDLLIELFSEEIPARMQARARADLKRMITDGLVEAGLTYAHAAAFSTPRRLTLAVEGLTDRSPDVKEERKGPKADAPEKAVEGFLRSTGLTRDQLETRETPKGDVLFAVIDRPGRPAPEIIAEVLEHTIRNFPWPKSMRWGAGSLRWVRPLHSILCILARDEGAEIVPLEVDGIQSGDTTWGHRFLSKGQISVTSFEDYAAKLKRAHVVLDATEREEHIWHEAEQMAFAAGLELVEDKGLLTEVAGLVEWPVVLMGAIDAEFLELPPEVLQTSMREHQKFFSLKNPKSGRIERFITVANNETADNGATILAGNQKVLSARLSDAKFFWENDLRTVEKIGLEGLAKGLENVTFHQRLGTQAERVARIEAFARDIAPLVGADADQAALAARVAKADLQSEMVYEFPELQGLMGRYYAQEQGLPDEVAQACEMHYKPLGPSDEVPSEPVSAAIALADKIDTLTGFWVIDETPTGSKDPYALRRSTLGVIRLILEKSLRVSLLDRFSSAQKILGAPRPNPSDSDNYAGMHVEFNLLAFFHDRLKVYLKDEGIRHDVIDAVLAMPNDDDLTLVVKRAKALSEFLKTDDGENLLQGFKRANNILTQAEEKDGVEYSYGADPKFSEGEAEKALFSALDQAEGAITPAMEAEDFAGAMSAMAALRAPIDAFFEDVQVNTENQMVRRNRLNLLHRIRTICLLVADLTKVEG